MSVSATLIVLAVLVVLRLLIAVTHAILDRQDRTAPPAQRRLSSVPSIGAQVPRSDASTGTLAA